MSITLYVNADDFGLDRDIDAGILQCIDGGTVQGVSFSPQGQSLDWDCLRLLQRQGIRTGLHLTLVGEKWGTNGRQFDRWPGLLRWLIAGGRAARRELEAEADWQIRQSLDHGVKPDHLDSHQHVHVFPGIWQTVLRLQREHRIRRIRTPRCPGIKLMKLTPAGTGLQMLAMRRSLGMNGQALPCLGLRHAGNNNIDVLLLELAILSHQAASGRKKLDTVEVVMHPGCNSPRLKAHYPDWHFDWSAERDALLDPRLSDAMKFLGMKFQAISGC